MSKKTHNAIMKENEGKEFRILKAKFHVGKSYKAGTLVIVSNDPLPKYNASDDVLVLDKGIVATLDLAGTTGPVGKAKTPTQDPPADDPDENPEEK